MKDIKLKFNNNTTIHRYYSGCVIAYNTKPSTVDEHYKMTALTEHLSHISFWFLTCLYLKMIDELYLCIVHAHFFSYTPIDDFLIYDDFQTSLWQVLS